MGAVVTPPADAAVETLRAQLRADPRMTDGSLSAAAEDAALQEYAAKFEAIAAMPCAAGAAAAKESADLIHKVLSFTPDERLAWDTFASSNMNNPALAARMGKNHLERGGSSFDSVGAAANSTIAAAGSAVAEAVPEEPPPPPSTDGGYEWPVNSRISQEWGGGHPGMDLAAVTGTPIKAATSGTVIQAGDAGDGYGIAVVIQSDDGETHVRYGHQSEAKVQVGQHVNKGEEIGLVGSTGQSTGPHLHLEFRVGGEWGETRNPRDYIHGEP